MSNSNVRELAPCDCRKSFYGKAKVYTSADGSETLYSYGTAIIKCTASGSMVRLWGGWSATTGRHIKAFCGLCKSQFMALPYTMTPADRAAAYSGTLYI